MKTLGKLYGVGIGPGDPELITVKALRIMESADFIAAAHSGGENIALHIASNYLADKEVIRCPMPMTRDIEQLEEFHKKSAAMITEKLDMGKTVAFITLGDPTIYSTYAYIHRLVSSAGYATEIIPGITSFCAAAARFNMSLCDGGEPLTIIPASYKNYDKYLKQEGVKVLMKSGKSLGAVKEKLKELGVANNAKLAERCGMQGERLFDNIEDAPADLGYFSVIIIK